MMVRPADVSTSGRTVPAAAASELCPLQVTQDIQSQANVRAAGVRQAAPSTVDCCSSAAMPLETASTDTETTKPAMCVWLVLALVGVEDST